MTDKAHKATDKQIEAMERYLNSVYKAEQKRLSKQLRAYATKLADKSNELLSDIEAAETIQDRQVAKLKYTEFYRKAIKSKEFKKLSKAVADSLFALNVKSAEEANAHTAEIYALNYNYLGGNMGKEIKQYDFKPVTIENADKYGELTKQTVDRKKDTEWNEKNITKSVLAGAALYLTADRIFDRSAKTVVNRNLSTAKMNANGMLSDAENKGRFDSISRVNDEGFSVGKTWKAVLDNRTRDSHLMLDNVTIPIDELFDNGLMKPRDPDGELSEICNCRCHITYDVGQAKSATRTYREGTVSGSFKKSSSYAGTSTEEVQYMNYREWMEWRKK